jgi:hypothetical protein
MYILGRKCAQKGGKKRPKTTDFAQFYVFMETSSAAFTVFCLPVARLFRILLFKPAVWGLAGRQMRGLAGRLFNFHLTTDL